MPLPLEIVRGIRAATETGKYGVSVMTNQRRQFAVVVGENHLKMTETERRAGIDLYRQFKLIGVERPDTGRLWGGRWFEAWAWRAFEDGEARAIATSTSQDSELVMEEIHNQVLARIRKAGMKIGRMSRDEARQAVLPIVCEELEGVLQKRFNLEEGHRFNWAEQLASVYYPLTPYAVPAGLVGLVGGAILSKIVGQPMGNFFSGFVVLAGLSSVHVQTGPSIADLFTEGSRWRSFFNPIEAFVANRDRTMARNIVKILWDHPEHETMAAWVGVGHVSGISRRLGRDHGFQSFSLPKS